MQVEVGYRVYSARLSVGGQVQPGDLEHSGILVVENSVGVTNYTFEYRDMTWTLDVQDEHGGVNNN